MSDTSPVIADRPLAEAFGGAGLWPDTIVNLYEDASGLHASLPVRRPPVRPANEPGPHDALRQFSDTPNRFRIRLANDEGRRNLASYLVSQRYGWRGYKVGPVRATPDQITLVASNDAHALATLSVGFESTTGLLVEKLYPQEVADLRASGARLCEFTRLAVEPGRHSQEVLAMLFHIAYIYARRIHRCTDLLIEVNPRHVRFYETALGFVRHGPERTCPRVLAPAILLRLDLGHCEQQLVTWGGQRKQAGRTRSLYPLGFSPEEESGILARLSRLD